LPVRANEENRLNKRVQYDKKIIFFHAIRLPEETVIYGIF